MNTLPIIDINLTCDTDEQAEKYYDKLVNIKEKYTGMRWNTETKLLMQNEMLNLQNYIDANDPFEGICVELDGPAAYNETTWYLEDLLKYCQRYCPDEYPLSYKDKGKYSRIEVNNMLFALYSVGVIEQYSDVLPDLPMNVLDDSYSVVFSEHESIIVTLKYNKKL